MKDENTTSWRRLDNNANIFPAISDKRLTSVYRLSAVLNEKINEENLQKALEKTLPHFDVFKVRLKKGFFWYYFEENNNIPIVEEESDLPNRYIDHVQSRKFLFRITYFKKRINLELFHALTDATGGMRFLTALCYEYIKINYSEDFSDEEKKVITGISYGKDTEDSYLKNYIPIDKEKFEVDRAYKMKDNYFPMNATSAIHGNLSIRQLKEISKKYKATISQYLTTTIAWSIYTEYLNKTTPKNLINIFIPVNLRPYFESTTSVNFFSGVTISFDFKEKETFESLLEKTKKQFVEKITLDTMLSKVSYTAGSGNNIFVRFVPLAIKNLVLKIAYGRSRKSNTLTLSNLGQINILPEFQKYFEKFYFLIGTSKKEYKKLGVVSFGDVLTLTFSGAEENARLEKAVFRKIAKDGADILIESNGVFYD